MLPVFKLKYKLIVFQEKQIKIPKYFEFRNFVFKLLENLSNNRNMSVRLLSFQFYLFSIFEEKYYLVIMQT